MYYIFYFPYKIHLVVDKELAPPVNQLNRFDALDINSSSSAKSKLNIEEENNLI